MGNNSLLVEMLKYAINKNATDLHLTAGVRPYVRINGQVIMAELPVLSTEQCDTLMLGMLTDEQARLFNTEKVIDFSFGEPGLGRFRVNIYQQQGTLAGAIRILPHDILPIDRLGLPVEVPKKFCELSNGLILVCGPVGSGKTTTLASMINHINQTRRTHIISIEDPIEYVHKNNKSLIHQREIRRDTNNFYDALKFILREDPDVVIIGEVRDLDTISSALTIAETGHLVMATLHTGDASESIRRIIDMYPQVQQTQIASQLSNVLLGVINQLLVPTVNNGARVLASEVMVVNSAIQNMIRENKIEQIYSHIQTGTNIGMQTMNQALHSYVRRGVITKAVALAQTKRTKELENLLEAGFA
jgi:twitching motility protein PilT